MEIVLAVEVEEGYKVSSRSRRLNRDSRRSRRLDRVRKMEYRWERVTIWISTHLIHPLR